MRGLHRLAFALLVGLLVSGVVSGRVEVLNLLINNVSEMAAMHRRRLSGEGKPTPSVLWMDDLQISEAT